MAGTGNGWWREVTGKSLLQGDLLPGCFVPSFRPDLGKSSGTHDVEVEEYDCIVLTQSCDLENRKAKLVALCPTIPIMEFEQYHQSFQSKGAWEQIRLGKNVGLHLLGSIEDPGDNRDCRVVNFREIYSLPIEYLQTHAGELGARWRLRSPYLEHLSQAFARFFMRVGLPSDIPSFK